MAGSEEEAEGVEWAPSRAAASEDEEMSEPDTDPDVDELAAAGGCRTQLLRALVGVGGARCRRSLPASQAGRG